MNRSLWFERHGVRSGFADAKLRLVCFPFAGGGPIAFRSWAHGIPEVELCVLRLPGRELRIRETRFRDVRVAAEAVAMAIETQVSPPYAFFGHSMGALLAFEVAVRLRERGLPLPERLVVSARGAPDVPIRTALYRLPDAEFAKVVESYGATPRAVLESSTFYSYVIPLIRDDFEMAENYTYRACEALALPITAIGARNDSLAPAPAIEAWRHFTSQTFEIRWFEGGHFFLCENPSAVMRFLGEVLASVGAASTLEKGENARCG